jgi:hypothetical protein
MPTRCAVALISLLVAVAACTSGGRVAVLKREPALTKEQIAERQATLARGEPMRPTASERFDIAVVGGECAPRKSAKRAITACVDDKPCNGFGLRTAAGAIVCACYEVRDGCPADSYCHQGTRACTKLPDDKYHVQ